jgi:uncharacterized protein (TIGR03000 family)
MIRLVLAVVLAVLLAAPALAQGLRGPPPTPPYRTGFRPIYPGGYPIAPSLRPWPLRPGVGPFWPGYVAPSYYPYGTGMYYGPGYYPPVVQTMQPLLPPPPLLGAGSTPLNVQVPINPELTAELTVEFPAEAEVTVNGAAVAGEGKVRTLTSPTLKFGLTHTFDVKARWSLDGQAYEWERTVTLGPGERSRITVARGFPVKD